MPEIIGQDGGDKPILKSKIRSILDARRTPLEEVETTDTNIVPAKDLGKSTPPTDFLRRFHDGNTLGEGLKGLKRERIKNILLREAEPDISSISEVEMSKSTTSAPESIENKTDGPQLYTSEQLKDFAELPLREKIMALYTSFDPDAPVTFDILNKTITLKEIEDAKLSAEESTKLQDFFRKVGGAEERRVKAAVKKDGQVSDVSPASVIDISKKNKINNENKEDKVIYSQVYTLEQLDNFAKLTLQEKIMALYTSFDPDAPVTFDILNKTISLKEIEDAKLSVKEMKELREIVLKVSNAEERRITAALQKDGPKPLREITISAKERIENLTVIFQYLTGSLHGHEFV